MDVIRSKRRTDGNAPGNLVLLCGRTLTHLTNGREETRRCGTVGSRVA